MRFLSIKINFTFFLFAGLSIWLNCSEQGGIFLFDANMWLLKYRQMDWSGLSTAFGDKTLHQVGHFFAFVCYKICGLEVKKWSIALALFHAINSYFFYLNIKQLLLQNQIKNANKIAFWGGFFFVISPYQTEITQWGSTLWYQACLLWLNVLLFLQMRLNNNNSVFLIPGILLTTVLSYFTWEFSYVFPLALLFLFCFSKSGYAIRHYTLFVFAPQLLLLGLFLYANKTVHQQALSHYNGYHFEWQNAVNNANYYLIKLSNLLLLLDYEKREEIQSFLDKNPIALFALAAIFVLLFIRKIKTQQNNRLFLYVFIALAALFILPIIHLNQVFNLRIEQDRYVYLALAFSSMAVSHFMVIQKKLVSFFLIVSLSFFSIKILRSNIHAWKVAYHTQMGLIDDYKWSNEKKVYLLTTADNCNGAYCLRSQPYSSFAESYLLFRGKDIFPAVKEVLQYNMLTEKDSFKTTKNNPLSYTAIFAQYGSWYWRNGYSAEQKFSNTAFDYSIDEWNMGFTVNLHDPSDTSAVVLIQQGKKWKRLN